MRHALKAMGAEVPQKDILKGPTALATTVDGELVDVARALAVFGKQFPSLQFKAGLTPDQWYGVDECKRLSTIPSRGVLVGTLASTLYTCISRMASVAQAPLRDLAWALKAVEDKKKKAGAAAA
jgi:large subunit ribosomal protein L10